MSRISGKSFDVNVGDMLVHVDKATLDIEDGRSVGMSRGVPNGMIDGDAKASGELEVDAANFKLISDAAASAGSWKELPEFDLVFYANTGNEEMKVEAFGVVLRISSLLDIDSSGGDKHMTKLPFDITSPDFVRINGTPYLSAKETEDLRS